MRARSFLFAALGVTLACSPDEPLQKVEKVAPVRASAARARAPADERKYDRQTRQIALPGEYDVPPQTQEIRIGYASEAAAPGARLVVERPRVLSRGFGWSVVADLPLRFEHGASRWHDLAIDLPPHTTRVRLRIEADDSAPETVLSRPAWIRESSARNLILISLDTLRADFLGTYGYERFPTSPGIDAFAEQGTVFEQAIASSPWTIPSHIAVFTGIDPNALGFDEFLTNTPRLHRKTTTLAELFRNNGALTAAFTGATTMSARNGFSDGFFEFHEAPLSIRYKDLTLNLERANRWLRKDAARPYFLFLHTFEIHDPYSHEEFASDDLTDQEEQRARYASGIAYVDRHLTPFLEALRADGLLDETLVVIMSDHGEGFDDDHVRLHGRTLFDDVLHVPLVFVGPDIPSGRRVSTQVSLQDLFATLADYFDLPTPPDLNSTSLLELVEGRSETPRDTYLCCLARYNKREGLRSGGFKYVLSHPKGKRTDALFDLSRDPGEQHNIAAWRPKLTTRLRNRTRTRTRTNRAEAAKVRMPSIVDDEYLEQLRALGYVD